MKKIVFCLLILMHASCASGSKEYQKAREFIDAYYVMADQKQALTLAEDPAYTILKKEIALLEEVSGKQNAYKTRDIEFEKLKEISRADEIIYLFELTLHFPNLAPQKRKISIIVNKNTTKVKFFGDLT